MQPDGPDLTEEDQMTPYVVLPKHEPVPMAMVSREPNGCMPFHPCHPMDSSDTFLTALF